MAMAEDLTWLPAWQIRELVGKREVSPVEVTEHFLGRIEEHDPTLKAFKTLDAEGARAQARAAEAAVSAGEPLGPLHGVPISVKEHIQVAGLPFMAPFGGPSRTARWDDLGVARLRDAGAVIVGTNTMMGTTSETPGTYNWDAEARNPWDPTRVPGWSSSGGAATAASRMLPVAIGSDGGGSTRLPAAYSGIVGVHPTAGLIPTVVYGAPVRRNPTGTIGPLTRHVLDAAITLQAMAGPDGRDFDCIQDDPGDYLATIEDGAEGLRLAWTDDYGFTPMYAFPGSDRIIATVRDAATGVTSLGASLETTDRRWEDFFPGLGGTAPLFGPSPDGTFDRTAYISGLELRQRNWDQFRALFRDHDLLLSPTSQLTAAPVEEWAARWEKGEGPVSFPHGTFAPHYTSHTHMFNWLGFPAVSVPCGFVDGLPVGLQIVGPPRSEARIFRLANAFQQAYPQLDHPPIS
jgi:aspartyl-tRNA(Asn)/glutamyl-tRNA(Gln) amidotransferase subunit A